MVSTNIQVIVFLFNIFKATKIPQSLLPQTQSQIRNNSNMTMLALAINFMYKVFKKCYILQREKVLGEYQPLPSEKWKNDYPVVLVHGFGGYAPDESLFFGDYFSYASDHAVSGNQQIYQADVSPFASLHDRACELYQQLIGIFETQRQANEQQLTLAEKVYGKQHANEDHKEQFYKPRYLRRVIKGKVFGYPNGIPGGWNLERKIHFIGHSQGGMTIRYLQYLLKNDFFNCGAQPKVDKSDWIASFSGINPILNGGIATYLFEYCLEKKKFLSPKEGTLGSYIFVEGCKVFSILQNLIQSNLTQNESREIIKNILKSSKEERNEVVWELGVQPYFFFDFNNENIGHNRREGESIPQYIKRVMASDILYESKDFAFAEFCPTHTKDINSKLEVNPNTYYFSYAGGARQCNYMKQREVLREPSKLSKMAFGYDLDTDQNLYFQGQSEKMTQKPRDKISTINNWLMSGKVALNIVSVTCKIFFQSYLHFRPPCDSLNNSLNPDMNNLMAIDYANKDWTHDSDMILPRWTEEYPKISSNYKLKDTKIKPWGRTDAPIFFDSQIDSIMMPSYEKGVWHYSSISMTDHHDFAGMPSRVSYIWQTMLGIEHRTQFWINILNRLRTLEYSEHAKQI